MTKQKSILWLLCLLWVNLLTVIITLQGLAQAAVQSPQVMYPANREPLGSGGGSGNGPQDELSEAERQAIQAEIDRNIALLETQGKLLPVTPSVVLFGWPIRPSPKLNDYAYHGISNFIDQNPAFPNQLLDYACGGRTYDTAGGYNHTGTDIFPWPLGWNRIDADEMEVVAAAPGVIVLKQDGNYDRNCSLNNNPWNAIYVQHSDGSVAWYGHLKRGSLTQKGLGNVVAAGEYLGIVGSSGNSTGPHLHFEVRDIANQLIDPYAGACNSLNNESWWVAQRPYDDSAVNKITTGHSPVQIAPCPAPDNLYLQDNFMPGDFVYFTTYYHDQLAGQESQYTIYMPNDTVYYSWTASSDEPHYQFSYWWWYFWLVPEAITGTWRFEVQYEANTYQTYFNWGDPTYITVTVPTTGTIWLPGSTQAIRWQDNLGGDVRLELYQGGDYLNTLAYHTASDGVFTWTLPLTLPRHLSYTVHVVNITNETLTADSGPFHVTYPLTVTSPQPLERWQPGQTYTITWQDSLTNPVRLELLHLGELSRTLALSATNNGVFTWTVPLTVANIVGYQVRLVDVLDILRYGQSGYFFMGDPMQTFLPVVSKPEP